MCGIYGIIMDNENIIEKIILGLSKLENRGYDSMGISILNKENQWFMKKIKNRKIEKLKEILSRKNEYLKSINGIGHTRWATHGKVSIKNAHPHEDTLYKIFRIVHNGIIDNYQEIKIRLQNRNIKFKSDTDTEIIVNLLVYEYRKLNEIKSIKERVKKGIENTIKELKGKYAILIQCKLLPTIIYGYRKDTPLLLGWNKENRVKIYVSEKQIFSKEINEYIILKNDKLYIEEIDEINEYIDKIKIEEKNENRKNEMENKYETLLEKEIREQKYLIKNIKKNERMKNKLNFYKKDRIMLIGSGTSYHSALFGHLLFAKYLPEYDIITSQDASNLKIENINLSKYNGIFMSQSGETRDLLNIIEKNDFNYKIGLCNVKDSSLSRMMDLNIYLNIGEERSVASTKSFTSQCINLINLCKNISRNDELNNNWKNELNRFDIELSKFIEDNFSIISIEWISNHFKKLKQCFIMGYGIDYVFSMEASLKLKEISRIYAEAYGACALKHGPFALLTNKSYVFFIWSEFEKLSYSIITNSLLEIASRNVNIYLICSENQYNIILEKIKKYKNINWIKIPSNKFNFIYISIIFQIISLKIAKMKKINPDFPPNIAKVVTVD